MIDVFLIHYHRCRRPTFVPRQARWFGPPTAARIAAIEREFPVIGDWIYRAVPDGRFGTKYVKWQFCGLYDY